MCNRCFHSVHTPYLAAEEKCNEVCSLRSQTCTILLVIFPFVLGPHQSINKQLPQVGGYLADVLDGDENNFIKSVLNVINPKVKTVIKRHKNHLIRFSK